VSLKHIYFVGSVQRYRRITGTSRNHAIADKLVLNMDVKHFSQEKTLKRVFTKKI